MKARSATLNGYKFKWEVGDTFEAGRCGSAKTVVSISKGKVYSCNGTEGKKQNCSRWCASEITPVGLTAKRYHDEFLAHLKMHSEG